MSRHPRLPDGVRDPVIEAVGVTVRRGGREVLRDVSLRVQPGELVAVVGPNGAGKSTLVGALAGDLRPARGEVLLDGRPVDAWSPVELAMRRAVLPQDQQVAFPFTAAEIVAMGRSPWARTPRCGEDPERVAEALAAVDAVHLASRRFPTLSGGERARVALARVLAQATALVLLDEPLAALDLHHQMLVLARARRHADDGGAVVAVLHDLTLAGAHADRVVLLSQGVVVATGTPGEVLEAERLSRVYRHRVEVLTNPLTGGRLVAAVPETNPRGAAADRACVGGSP